MTVWVMALISSGDLADSRRAARIEGRADVAQLVEQLIRNQ